MSRRILIGCSLCTLLVAGAGGWNAGFLTGTVNTGRVEPPRVVVAPGYTLSRVAHQFSAPVGAAVGDEGEIYVAESGAAAGTQPRVVRLGPGKRRTTVADDFRAPLTGITWHGGKLYVAYAGGVDVLDPANDIHHPVLAKLPAQGDYPNTAVVVGPDGKLYFGIGTATNSGVVGEDNIRGGWVKAAPTFRDIPCKTIKLKGSNFTIPNPLTPDPHDRATTGAFSPFSKTTARLQVIEGALPCTGAVLRANRDGTGLELVAWGLRHPAGLSFGPDGQLYATMQGFEDRGSRPIVQDRDYFYRIEQDRWYGWPDYAGGRSVTEEEFQKASFPAKPLLADIPGQPPAPVATFDHASGATGLIFPAESFGLRGDALVALFGSTAAGRMIVRVNPRGGIAVPFVRNEQPGGAGGLEHPIALASAPTGEIYVVDYGTTRSGAAGHEPVAGTGVLWQIKPAPARKAQGPWQWALVGVVLSCAGIHLVRRDDP